MMHIHELLEKLYEAKYIANMEIGYAAAGTIYGRTPLLIEGPAGSGKTYLAKAVADITGSELIRVQVYEGMTYDKILYDYDYQRQLLTIQAVHDAFASKIKGKSPQEAIETIKDVNFYGDDFLIARPVLKALTAKKPVVLLIDEIDKASEELEYTLLEVLDEFSMTIPQYGTIRCSEENRPMVFLTSNNYRELSDALKRRCNYLYIPSKTTKELTEILKVQAGVDEQLANSVAKCAEQIRNLQLKQTPSIAEFTAWAKFLKEHEEEEIELKNTVYMIAKNQHDTQAIRTVIGDKTL